MARHRSVQLHTGESLLEIPSGDIQSGDAAFSLRFTVPPTLYLEEHPEGVRIKRERDTGETVAETPLNSGQPSIPALGFELAVPANTLNVKAEDINATYAESTTSVDVLPVPEPALHDTGPSDQPQYRRDPAIYEKDTFFPADSELVQVGPEPHSRFPFQGLLLATVRFFLAQYNPVQKKLRFPLEVTANLRCGLDAEKESGYAARVIERAHSKDRKGELYNLQTL